MFILEAAIQHRSCSRLKTILSFAAGQTWWLCVFRPSLVSWAHLKRLKGSQKQIPMLTSPWSLIRFALGDLMQILQVDTVSDDIHICSGSVLCVCMCAWNKWKVHKLNLLTEAQKDLLEMHGTGSWYKMAGLKSSRLRTSQNLLAWHDRQEKEAPQSLRQLAAGCFRMCLHLLRSACLHSLHHCGLFISSHYRSFSFFGLIEPLASISIH